MENSQTATIARPECDLNRSVSGADYMFFRDERRLQDAQTRAHHAVRLWPVTKLSSDKWAHILRAQSSEEYEGLRNSIIERGVLSPLVITKDGTIIDGHHRFRAAMETGEKEVPCIVETFTSDDAAREFILKLQLDRRNISPAERDEILGHLYKIKKKPAHRPKKLESSSTFSKGSTACTLARQHDVSERTVRKAGKRVLFTEEYPQFNGDSTDSILALQKLLKNLMIAERDELLTLANLHKLDARKVTSAAQIMDQTGASADEAVRAVSEGHTDELLNECDLGEQSRGQAGFSSRHESGEFEEAGDGMSQTELEDPLGKIISTLKRILAAGRESGADLETFPWRDISNLIKNV